MSSWGHDSGGLSAVFLEHSEVGWNIKLDIKAAALVRRFNHGQDALLVGVSGTLHFICGV